VSLFPRRLTVAQLAATTSLIPRGVPLCNGAPLLLPAACETKADIVVGRGIVALDRTVDRVTAAMRRLLCLLVGHKPGKPVDVMGLQVRNCSRCGRAL
jgi:hypothetical protein